MIRNRWMNVIDELILDWWKDTDELNSSIDGQMYNKMMIDDEWMNRWMDEWVGKQLWQNHYRGRDAENLGNWATTGS